MTRARRMTDIRLIERWWPVAEVGTNPGARASRPHRPVAAPPWFVCGWDAPRVRRTRRSREKGALVLGAPHLRPEVEQREIIVPVDD